MDCQAEEVDLQAEDVMVVEEMDMTQEMEMKRGMRMMLLPLPLKIQERFPLKTGPMDPDNDGHYRRRWPPK